jgi:hypothetical protein
MLSVCGTGDSHSAGSINKKNNTTAINIFFIIVNAIGITRFKFHIFDLKIRCEAIFAFIITENVPVD